MKTLRSVSLFSNCGAGDLGYRSAGFRFDVLAELVEFRLDVALLNHPVAWGVVGDLRETLPDVVECWRASRGEQRPAMLSACPPCQGMSSARGGRGTINDPRAGSRDPRNLLVEVVANAVKRLKPRSVVVENVPMFLTRQVHHPKNQQAVSAAVFLVDELCEEYAAYAMRADLADFGIPQSRKRSFLTFIRRDEVAISKLEAAGAVPYPQATHIGKHVSIKAALAAMRLPPLDARDERVARDPKRPLHIVPVWDERTYAMVAAIPPSSGQTAWQNNLCRDCGTVKVGSNEASCPRCRSPLLRPVVVESNGNVRLVNGFRNSSYSRMRPDKAAATITTASGRVGSDNTIHPWENRLLSPLECAELQTFPKDFEWGEALRVRGVSNLRCMIGEAVPPMFTAAHGRVLASLLNGSLPRGVMKADDLKVIRAQQALDDARSAVGS